MDIRVDPIKIYVGVKQLGSFSALLIAESQNK
jgi:hypothetical protein